MNRKKFAVAIVAVGLMAASVGAVNAQAGDPAAPTSPGASALQGAPGFGPRERQLGRPIMRQLIDTIAEQFGMEVEDILADLRDGGTLTDVIITAGGDVQAVSNAVIAEATERINEAVANGNLRQERADTLLEALPVQVADALTTDPTLFHFAPAQATRLVRQVGQASGLDGRAMLEAIRAGSTLESVLIENGVDTATFIDEQVAAAEQMLARAVENGRLTQEEADATLVSVRANIEEALRYDFPNRLGEI